VTFIYFILFLFYLIVFYTYAACSRTASVIWKR